MPYKPSDFPVGKTVNFDGKYGKTTAASRTGITVKWNNGTTSRVSTARLKQGHHRPMTW